MIAVIVVEQAGDVAWSCHQGRRAAAALEGNCGYWAGSLITAGRTVTFTCGSINSRQEASWVSCTSALPVYGNDGHVPEPGDYIYVPASLRVTRTDDVRIIHLDAFDVRDAGPGTARESPVQCFPPSEPAGSGVLTRPAATSPSAAAGARRRSIPMRRGGAAGLSHSPSEQAPEAQEGWDGLFWSFAGVALCLGFGIHGLVTGPPKPLPPIPASGPLTQAESAAYTGPVTPGTYLRFMNWAGDLRLGTVGAKSGSQTTSSGTSSGSVSGGFIFLGVGGLGEGSTSSTSSGTSETLPYRAYEFAVTNDAGQTIIVTFPATSLEFSQIPAGQTPSVRFVFNTTIYYSKSADRTSIFAAGEDPNASGSGPGGGDMGLVFANTPPGVLLGQYVVAVQAQVTEAQFAALTNPQLAGAPAA